MITINQIDAYYCGFPNVSAIYLLRDFATGESALIDSGTIGSYDKILNSLHLLGIKKNDLTKLIITHEHLDHSANACLFTRDFPHIQVYGHPLTLSALESPFEWKERVKHITRTRSYKRDFEGMTSTPSYFLHSIREGSQIQLGKSKLQIFECPGHCLSCVSILAQSKKGSNLFCGDAYGTRYKQISNKSIVSCPIVAETSFSIKFSLFLFTISVCLPCT